MSRLNSVLEEFREFKNNPPKRGLISSALHGLKKSVIIPVPTFVDPIQRWYFMVFMLELAWSNVASGSIMTGALLSLLSLFAENPGAMVRSLLNDPDLDVQIAEVSRASKDEIKLATRGKNMEDYEKELIRIAGYGPYQGTKTDPFPFVKKDQDKMITKTTEDLQLAVQTVTIQIWILLTKAVTATDTAKESENRRWVKYLQQRRADRDYKLEDTWLNLARARIAEDISVRRYMVEILIETNKMAGVKTRIVEMISDIGNYISEAGMAGFFLTIKYGIETKYPALALNELQADLSIILSLMKTYTSLGEKAPYMVILEDAIQTKFSPGNYPLLWSYAMGVGSVLDRAVNNLNYTRPYLEHSFFQLGETMVEKMEGTVNNRIAAELDLSPEQVQSIRSIVKLDQATSGPRVSGPQQKTSGPRPFELYNAGDIIPEIEEEVSDEDKKDTYDVSKVVPVPNANSIFYDKDNQKDKRNLPKPPKPSRSGKKVNNLKESLNDALEDFVRDESMTQKLNKYDEDDVSYSTDQSPATMSDLDALRS
ncbi:N protein [Mount Mabu Lophuromys virus 2]|uniref:Nucleocapsid n=1 Tax=Mount Mabu Lophuromys virus 2 TaxID=2116560 RepID=A0A2P1GJ93_9MONO|nr:N protein [Mount Mabu Lophuromys virus 2]AVM86020.1 N protein [Mount Mabu Lophuromys virus 2]